MPARDARWPLGRAALRRYRHLNQRSQFPDSCAATAREVRLYCTRMAATKGTRVKRKTSKKRITRRATATHWAERTNRGLRILQVPELAKLTWLVHGFSTRPGGASQLDSQRVLNLGFTEWDARENVKQNRARLQAAVGAQDLKLVSLLQFHSDSILHFESAPTEPSRADASVTKTAGLLLAVQTADCVPILLVDPKNRAVAAVHCGWGGYFCAN